MKVARDAQAAVLEMEGEARNIVQERDDEENIDFLHETQLIRSFAINGFYLDSNEEMTVDQHYRALICIGAIGEEWRVYNQRLGYDTRPLTDRREPVPQGAFSHR